MKSVSVWPGFVDSLSALLMVVIFVLLIFVLAQYMLSEILYGQESELSALHRHMSEIVKRLGLAQEENEALQTRITSLSAQVSDLSATKDHLQTRLTALEDKTKSDEAELEKRLLMIAGLQEDISALRTVRERLEKEVGSLAAALDTEKQTAAALRDRSKTLEAGLADERERTHLIQKKIEARDIRIQALVALVDEQKEALDDGAKLTADARAEVVLLSRQIENMNMQLAEIRKALKSAELEGLAKDDQIKELGKRLNIALAMRVNKLEKYRSDFFGRLRELIGDNPNLVIQGDRFVLQAELLFDSGSAELGESGRIHLGNLARIIIRLSETIPDDINWILRIDGHTDKRPINTERFSSNWELSTARAVSVVRYLAEKGVPEHRMTAAGFSKYYPLDSADTPEAFRKNRRIEIKLTSR